MSTPDADPNPAPTARKATWRDWRAAPHAWGPPGNERLTTSVGLVLLILLTAEALTTISLHTYLSVHIFLGMLLLTPVALKLSTTGWRFMRYYTNNRSYRLEGPPKLLLRLLAPLLVVSTVTLFGSGVALILVGHGGGPLLTLHAASFAVWGAVMVIHILAYLARAARVGQADWRPHATVIVAGARSRRATVIGALLAGIIIALATYPTQQSWLKHRHRHGHDGGPAHAALSRTSTRPGAARRRA